MTSTSAEVVQSTRGEVSVWVKPVSSFAEKRMDDASNRCNVIGFVTYSGHSEATLMVVTSVNASSDSVLCTRGAVHLKVRPTSPAL
jgi:hypothetical protein